MKSMRIQPIPWPRVAQVLIGLFFIGSAFYKLQNYFIVGDLYLENHFQFWIDSGYPPAWYVP